MRFRNSYIRPQMASEKLYYRGLNADQWSIAVMIWGHTFCLSPSLVPSVSLLKGYDKNGKFYGTRLRHVIATRAQLLCIAVCVQIDLWLIYLPAYFCRFQRQTFRMFDLPWSIIISPINPSCNAVSISFSRRRVIARVN